MTNKRDPTKALQIGFLVLLAFTSAQVAWWIAENVHYSRYVKQRIEALYRADAAALDAMRKTASAQQIEALLPHLQQNSEHRTSVRQKALDALESESSRRINRYQWEGGFFLLVLISGMSVLTSAIRFDADLRRRQQNFLAAVSHEFKSPLASIRLAAETLILRSTEPVSERLGRRILADDERLLRMVENLLDTTRLEEGRHTASPEITALVPAVTASIDAIAERAKAHEIAAGVECETPLSLLVDRITLETILRNLLDNAVKACIAGHGRRITVRIEHRAGAVVIAVNDDGLGFMPEEATLMFEKFYRLGDELQRTTQGTGLGLYIVKRLAEISGARVDASSPGPGHGATVSISWPDRYLA